MKFCLIWSNTHKTPKTILSNGIPSKKELITEKKGLKTKIYQPGLNNYHCNVLVPSCADKALTIKEVFQIFPSLP